MGAQFKVRTRRLLISPQICPVNVPEACQMRRDHSWVSDF